jgi:hypothetical protein
MIDKGFMPLKEATDAGKFIKACRALRLWDREAGVDADAKAVPKDNKPPSVAHPARAVSTPGAD